MISKKLILIFLGIVALKSDFTIAHEHNHEHDKAAEHSHHDHSDNQEHNHHTHDHDHEHHDHEKHDHHSHEHHDHHHSHDHSADHHSHSHDKTQDSIIDYETALFSQNENKDDINVKIVMWICKRTKAHLFIKVFDDVIKPLPQMAQALLSTVFISVVPIGLIYVLNSMFMNTKEMRETMTQYMISFAIGGLLGDVFFHTLPHMNAGGGHGHSNSHGDGDHHDHSHHNHGHNHGDHSHNPEEMRNNFIVIIGIIAFFLME